MMHLIKFPVLPPRNILTNTLTLNVIWYLIKNNPFKGIRDITFMMPRR